MGVPPPPPYGIPPPMSLPQFPTAANLDPLSTAVLLVSLPAPYVCRASASAGPPDASFVSPQAPAPAAGPRGARAAGLLRELAAATTHAHSGVKAVHALGVPAGKDGAAVVRMGSKAGAASLCRMIPVVLPGVRCLPSRAVMAFPGTTIADDDAEATIDEELLAKLRETVERHKAGEVGEKAVEGGEAKSASPEKTSGVQALQALDAQKVAAAAGGQYDEEEDPLNAPEVLAAVSKFKKNIEEQHANSRRKRAEEVRKRVRDRMKWAHAQIEEGRRAEEERERGATAPPDASGGLPELPPQTAVPAASVAVGLPPAQVGGKDSGRRGISNLPAWMTKGGGAAGTAETALKRPLATSADGFQGPDRRRPRLEGVEGAAAIRAANEAADAAAAIVASASTMPIGGILATPIPWDMVEKSGLAAGLRPWVAGKIVEYLGEEEETMIDFVMDQVRRRCNPEEILNEMRPVLDDDADVFVIALWKILIRCKVE